MMRSGSRRCKNTYICQPAALSRQSSVPLSGRLAAALARRGVHYGWVVVAAAFLTMLVTAGAVGAPGVLLLPLQREFGWSTAAISSAMAVRLLPFGLMGPFAAATGTAGT